MRAGAKRRRREGTGVNMSSPQWMVSYSDMVTQVLAFFIMLFAVSTVDVQRFQALMSAFQGSLGILEGGRTFDAQTMMGAPPVQVIPNVASRYSAEQLQRVAEEVAREFEGTEFGEDVQLIPEERGVVVRVANRVLFDLGKADLRPESRQVLDALARVLAGLPNLVRIEGHTDDIPIHNERFASNWELSTARATQVVRYFVEQKRLLPRRFSAAGYGEYWPLVPNASDANRQKNRRVDVVILRVDLTEERSP